MICDLPNKILTSLTFNLVLYFMTNLRRTPGHFFVFLLFTFTCTLTMSMYFRCIGALSRSLPEVRILPSLALVIVGLADESISDEIIQSLYDQLRLVFSLFCFII